MRSRLDFWQSPVFEQPKGFKKSQFFNPKATELKEEVEVEMWIENLSGILNQSNYRQVKVVYSNFGEIKSIENIREKTVQGD